MAETRVCRLPPIAARMISWAGHAALGMALVLFCLIAGEAHAGNDPLKSYRYGYEAGDKASGVTDLVVSDDFSCNADGTTSGTLFVNQMCEAAGLLGVFANVVCRVENLFGTILGLVYCAVQNAIIEPLLALFTLYVTLYGALVILGMVGHSFTEAISRVFKIALVSAIALNADIAIGVGYKFYISAAQTTVAIVFDTFDPDSGNLYETNPAMADMIAGGYMASPYNEDETKRLRSGEHWLEGIDATIHKIIGFFVQGGIGFVIVMAALFVLMPPMFFIVIYLMLSIIKAFAQAIIGYLLALLGITFLFTVAPIFVSFALFRVTAGWFEVWLKHLAGFTIQLMIVFMFLMFMLMVDLVTFFQSIGGLIRQYQHVFSFGFIYVPMNVYTLCRVRRDGPDEMSGDIKYFRFNQYGIMSDQEGSRYEGFPQCIPEYTLENLPPQLSPEQVEQLRETINEIRDDTGETPGLDQLPEGLQVVHQIIDKANQDLKIPFMELITTTDLIFFLLVRFIVVIILTYLLDRFMKKVPHMAAYLAGSSFSGRLGGGENEAGEAPGLQDTNDFGGLDSAYAKFKAASLRDGNYPRGFIRSAPLRFARGLGAAVGGAGQGMLRKSLVNAGNLGLRNDLRKELAESPEILESQREGLFAPSRGDGFGKPGGLYHPGGRGGRVLPSNFKGHRRSRRGM